MYAGAVEYCISRKPVSCEWGKWSWPPPLNDNSSSSLNEKVRSGIDRAMATNEYGKRSSGELWDCKAVSDEARNAGTVGWCKFPCASYSPLYTTVILKGLITTRPVSGSDPSPRSSVQCRDRLRYVLFASLSDTLSKFIRNRRTMFQE